MDAPENIPPIVSPETVPASEQAFRRLRDQVAELNGLCAIFREPFDCDQVFRRLVTTAGRLAGADGCTVYRRVGDELRFVVVRSPAIGLIDGDELAKQDAFVPISLTGESARMSVAARTVLDAEPVNVPDVTRLPDYDASRTALFDRVTGYTTRSLLSVPIVYRGGPVVGVLQLVNAKNAVGNHVTFDGNHTAIAQSVATLAGLVWTLGDIGDISDTAAS